MPPWPEPRGCSRSSLKSPCKSQNPKRRFTTRFAGENGGAGRKKENVAGIEGGEYTAFNSRNPFLEEKFEKSF